MLGIRDENKKMKFALSLKKIQFLERRGQMYTGHNDEIVHRLQIDCVTIYINTIYINTNKIISES